MKAFLRFLAITLLLGIAACAGILGIKPRDAQQHPFEHRAHSNAGIDCLACHAGVPHAKDEGPLHIPVTATCVGCHQKPHDTHPCVECHGEAHTREEDVLAREHLRFSHAEHVPKLEGQCVPCHAAAGKTSQVTLRPPMAQCLGCHAHKDQWKTADCEGCHVDLPAERVTPSSHVFHEGNFIREHGVRAASAKELCASCHGEQFCASCHGLTVPALPWKLAFDRPNLVGLHRAGFVSRHSDEAHADPGLCATCHNSEGFCLDCHNRRGRSALAANPANPHPPNWVRARGGEHGQAARMDPMSCAGCHGGAGEALCVGCHHVGGPGGNPHGHGFVSPLDRKRDQPCRQCHVT